jgi:hypothetical protein
MAISLTWFRKTAAMRCDTRDESFPNIAATRLAGLGQSLVSFCERMT